MALLSSMFTVNRNLFLRTLFLLSSLTVATAVAARMNATSLAVHQIAMQLWLFCSFALDSFAIAGQSIAGRLKGQKSAKALHTYGFLLQYWGLATGFLFAAVLYLGKPLLLSLFTTDEQVLLLLTGLYPFIIFLQPMNGITFILDGFLTGVLDTGWLMIQLIVAGGIVFIPISLLSLKLDWGITGLWWGLSAFLITRFAFNEFRFITQGYPNGRR
jgi:Na+-driven multidrug efflux pump